MFICTSQRRTRSLGSTNLLEIRTGFHYKSLHVMTVGAAAAGVVVEVEGLAVVGVVAVPIEVEELDKAQMEETTRLGNVHGKTKTRRAAVIITEREGTIRKWRERALVLLADRTLLFTYTSRLLNLILSTPRYSHVPYQVSSTMPRRRFRLTTRKKKSTKKTPESDDYGAPTEEEYQSWPLFSMFVVRDEKEKESVFKRGDV